MPPVTVTVSRSFTFDPAKQPEMVSELRGLAERGFNVLGPVLFDPVPEPAKETGDLLPVGSVARCSATRAEIASAIEEIKSLSGLSETGVGRLLGVSQPLIYAWRRGDVQMLNRRWDAVQALLRRARKLPAGSSRLVDEARGAAVASKRLAKKASRTFLTDDQKIEIAALHEQGTSVDEIAGRFAVSVSRVRQIAKLFA
jgi:hypothetical protein